MRPIDVLCEEERLRRLSERMVYDSSDGAEHARQRRARTLVEEMSLLGSRLRSKSNEDRRFDAVEALEAGLEARRKASQASLLAKEGASVPASAPPQVASDLQSDLSDALERVSVRSVVGLRGLVEVPRPVEAVVVAVLQLVNCDYAGVDLDPSPPPTTWEEARRVLLKPGHFVSALRKFPFALQRGQILEREIAQAEQAWSNVPSAGAGLSHVHEAALHLYDWLTIALSFAKSIKAEAESAERLPAYPRSEPGSPDWKEPIAPSTQPSIVSTIAKSSERPPEPQGREVQVRDARNASKTQKRSPSPKLPHKPSTATTATNDTARITWSKTSTSSTGSMSTSPGSSRSGFSASWSGLATCKPTHTRSRVSVPGTSPRRSSPSPTSGLSAVKPSSTSIAASSMRSPQPRTRQAMRTSTSPQPKPKAKDEAEAGQPRATGDIAPLSSSQISSLRSATGLPTAEDFAAMRSRLDQEKREVRQIKSLESQLKWGLQREERRQTEEERREEARLIMEWRDRQAKEMKDFVEEKSREQRVQELLQSKEYQVFKREWKQATRKDEIEQIKAQLAEGMDNAHWKLELQRAVELDRQLALQETMESQQEMKELRERERQHEKTVQLQDRAHDLALEYAHQASQISSEKEELLRSLALLRQRQKLPVTGNATRAGTTFWPTAR